MTTARDVMSSGAQCIKEDQSLREAARMMKDLGVGSLPICGTDDKLHGMITDRDIVIGCVAEGGNCDETTAGSMAQGKVFWVEADADIDQALNMMERNQVKRLPVIEKGRLVGMISESDVTRSLDGARITEYAKEVYAK